MCSRCFYFQGLVSDIASTFQAYGSYKPAKTIPYVPFIFAVLKRLFFLELESNWSPILPGRYFG